MSAVATAAAPLSVAQEALWVVAALAPGRLSYHETVSFRKDGGLDVPALERAFAELVRRHASLRTAFPRVGGRPEQAVGPPPRSRLPAVDLSHLPMEAAEGRAVQLVAERSRLPYDVRRGPLVRPLLVHFPEDHHRLYLAMHHIVFDGVSLFRVVLGELVALYDAFRAGEPSPLPEPTATYADYARWEQEWIEGPRAARRLAYWRDRLSDPPVLALPADRPRPEVPRFRGGAVALTVATPVVESLRATGHAVGASLFQALAAIWALLLSRWADGDDVVFATPCDLRQRPEFERVVGYAITPLVLRLDTGGDPAFTELVVRARNTLLDGLDNAVPFERVARTLPTAAGTGANPVYQTVLVLEPPLAESGSAWSLHLMEDAIGDAVGGTRLDLELQLDERPEGHLAGRLLYDRDLFDAGTAERLADQFARAAMAVAADPSLPASSVPLDDAVAERERLAAFNTALVEPPAPTVGDGVRERAREVLAEAGLSVADPPEAELLHAVAGLGVLGLGPQDTVLVLPSTLAHKPAVALWLPLLAGARVLLADPELEADGARLSRQASRAGVSFLHAVPATWQALVDTGLSPARALRGLSGGGPLGRGLADALLARCQVLWNAYGTTDDAAYGLAGRVEPGGPVTVGRPLAGWSAEVLDRHGRPSPIGVWGALRLRPPAGDARAMADRARWRPDGTVELAPTDVPTAGPPRA